MLYIPASSPLEQNEGMRKARLSSEAAEKRRKEKIKKFLTAGWKQGKVQARREAAGG